MISFSQQLEWSIKRGFQQRKEEISHSNEAQFSQIVAEAPPTHGQRLQELIRRPGCSGVFCDNALKTTVGQEQRLDTKWFSQKNPGWWSQFLGVQATRRWPWLLGLCSAFRKYKPRKVIQTENSPAFLSMYMLPTTAHQLTHSCHGANAQHPLAMIVDRAGGAFGQDLQLCVVLNHTEQKFLGL